MKKYIFFLFICISTLSAFSQESPKRIKIKELLELTGSAKVGLMVTKSLIATFQNSYPKVEQKFWDDFSNEIKAEDMIDILVPIYDKYYTDDDLDQLIAFYKTPIGKKTIEVLPQISQESMLAGQAWGKQIGEKLAKKLKEKGY